MNPIPVNSISKKVDFHMGNKRSIKKTNLWSDLLLIRISLGMYGVFLREDYCRNMSIFAKALMWIIRCFCFMYMHFYICYLFGQVFQSFWEGMAWFLQCTIATISLYLLNIRRGRIVDLLNQIQGVRQRYNTEKRCFCGTIVICSMWSILLTWAGIFIWWVSNLSIDGINDLFTYYFYSPNAVNEYPAWLLYFLGGGEWLGYLYFINGILYVCLSSYIAISRLLYHEFASFNKEAKQISLTPASLTPERSFYLLDWYHELCDMVETLEFLYSPLVSLWFLLVVFVICVEITSRLTSSKIMDHSDPSCIAYDSYVFIYWLLVFIATNFAGHRVIEEANLSLPYLDILAMENPPDLQVCHAVHLALSRLEMRRVNLSAWNFFSLSRGMLLTMAGGLFTYVVLIIQFAPMLDIGV